MAATNVSEMASTSLLGEMAYGYRILFYMLRPSETKHETLAEVPSYLLQVGKYLPMYLMTEILLLWLQRKRLPRWNDGITSVCCLALILIPIAILGNFEMNMYSWLHENYRLVDLPWDSTFTWLCGVLVADLGFYLWHRAAHEVNIFWSFHQVHHTPEDFNIFTGARLPTFNRQIAILFYLPGAFFVPPSVFYTHYQLNYIFQFWIHTDAVPSLGFIENFINTPSLHRVHHGRNRYCIDKNYGAVFSIWDRLFGTMEKEKKGEKIYYGLVHPIRSWDTFFMQFHHLKHMFKTAYSYDNWGDKLSVFFKGPGWYPGTPRLGYVTDVPVQPDDDDVYDKTLPLWANIYCALQLVVFAMLFRTVPLIKAMYPGVWTWIFGLYLFWGIVEIGWILEHKSYVPKLEICRAFLYFVLEFLLRDALATQAFVTQFARVAFLGTIFLWYNKRDCFANGSLEGKKVN